VTERRAERLFLDTRIPVTLAGGLLLAIVVADWFDARTPHTLAAALLPAALFHVAFLFPWALAVARFTPAVVVGPYLLCAILAAFAVRAVGGLLEARAAVSPLVEALTLAGGTTVAVRVLRELQRSQTRRARGDGLPEARWTGGDSDLAFLARGIAHAMTKPVTSVRHRLLVLASKPGVGEIKRELEGAAEVLGHLQRFLRDVLDLARAQSQAETRQVDLSRLVSQVSEEVKERFQDAVIDMSLEAAWLLGDELSLRCLAANLIENALEAGKDRAWARVVVACRSSTIELSVEDRGEGVPFAARPRIFQPFVTTKIRGTGLGLAVVAQIARAHGGTAVCEDSPIGARFVVRLPRHPDAPGASPL
jgi:signal transduction histidine kinase